MFYYFIIVSCFHLSLASWLLFSNKVQFSSVELKAQNTLAGLWLAWINPNQNVHGKCDCCCMQGDRVQFEVLAYPFHSSEVTGLDLCIRKPLVATCSLDKSVRIWNYETWFVFPSSSLLKDSLKYNAMTEMH